MRLVIKDERDSGWGVSVQLTGAVEDATKMDTLLAALVPLLGQGYTLANVMHPKQYVTVTWEHLPTYILELQTPPEKMEDD
jgi:hypothetical protein